MTRTERRYRCLMHRLVAVCDAIEAIGVAVQQGDTALERQRQRRLEEAACALASALAGLRGGEKKQRSQSP
jgi:hypothetical protein